MVQWLTNLTRKHEVTGLIPGLPQWVRLQTQLVSHVVWLWYRLVAIAPTQPPILGTSICRECDPKNSKKQTENNPKKFVS